MGHPHPDQPLCLPLYLSRSHSRNHSHRPPQAREAQSNGKVLSSSMPRPSRHRDSKYSWLLCSVQVTRTLSIGLYGLVLISFVRHAETWPDRIIINVAKEGVLDHPELQTWIRGHHHSVAVIQFKAHARNIEQSLNEKCHMLLLKVLTERRTVSLSILICYRL
jgi:hypothetical protein